MGLSNKDFFINGEWVPSESSRTLPVTNPATGEVVGEVPLGTAADADRALRAAQAAFDGWRARPMAERAALQHTAAAGLRERISDFARALTMELGRPLTGSHKEIERSAELLDYFAEEGLRLRGEIPMLNLPDERVFVVKEPVGVVVAIAPFNYPINLLCFKLGPALITGCTVVAKPAADTPLTTLMLAEVFHAAGFPPGVFNVVTGRGSEIGQALVEHPIPRKIGFTGGNAVGKRIAAAAAQTNKRLTLELGGQCPAIVSADADLEVALPALLRQTFANSGQFCYRVNRMYVQQGIYAAFCERFAQAARGLTVGNGLNPECQVGPLANKDTFRKTSKHVQDALQKGARLEAGGERLTGPGFDGGYFWPPTVLVDADHSMQIMTEETFGPVVGLMPVEMLDEAITYANDSPYGLAAFVFSKDLANALRAAERCEAGSVWVNNIHATYNQAPFGGFKESGLGREKSRYGLEEYLELKTIYLSF
ncbi:MAG TPA: aldehyde dehydrogenase family protein [Anaerolineales bacterium]|nr:NAD-dependent succinate-semialdehyde dehydrogenase [Anaerolineaceae bacterium]MDP7345619.1 aldehyde dehydrogenase family protein [Anaerolineales bacterium]MEE1543053.1 aldehyde dehydrogenase family protein [Alphaproteobacteria bacterium]HJN41289.1 aldehyde dehydrogenase family protein [Anaerolineales bacterium]